jgi:molecular chaperone DnaK (HSP70)
LTALLFALAIGTPAFATAIVLRLEGTSDAIGPNGVLLQAIGIQINGEEFMQILPRGCKLPCSRSHQFETKDTGQPGLAFRVFRGNSSTVKEAQPLGLVRVSGFPVEHNRTAHVVVLFIADSSGVSVATAETLTLEHVAP